MSYRVTVLVSFHDSANDEGLFIERVYSPVLIVRALCTRSRHNLTPVRDLGIVTPTLVVDLRAVAAVFCIQAFSACD